jgi:hypothetical protein
MMTARDKKNVSATRAMLASTVNKSLVHRSFVRMTGSVCTWDRMHSAAFARGRRFLLGSSARTAMGIVTSIHANMVDRAPIPDMADGQF